jgi:hypothetical protein
MIDEVNGCYGASDNAIPPFILLPRTQSLNCGPTDIVQQEKSLFNLLNGINSTKRGKSKDAVYSHYITLGAHAKRGSHGISLKSVKKTLKDEFDAVIKMVQKAEHCSKSVLPSAIIKAVKRTKDLFEWTSFGCNLNQKERTESILWPSVATSYDYTSSAHIDSDFFLSMLTVTNYEHTKDQKYVMNQPIALYFVFPELGVAVGLRPGDHLIFNPLYYHCVSTKDFHTYINPVHVTSFYLKTAVVGGNDNSKTLEQKLFLK